MASRLIRSALALILLAPQVSPQAAVPDLRTRAWSLVAEINKQAGGRFVRKGVPVWMAWCQDVVLSNTKDREICDDYFVPARGLNVKYSRQSPADRPTLRDPDYFKLHRRISIHFNRVVSGDLLSYSQPGYQPGWLLSDEALDHHLKSGSEAKYLFPFKDDLPDPRHLADPRLLQKNVPVTVKASWWIFSHKAVCEDPNSATLPVYIPKNAPSDSRAYPPEDWPDKITIGFGHPEDFQRKFGRPCPRYQAPSTSVPIERFWNYLAREQVDAADPIPAGTLAVLTGLHVASRESKDWVWTTLWWEPDRLRQKVLGMGREKHQSLTREPWKNYVLATTESLDYAVFNPYIEASLENGRNSNCRGCHRLAGTQRYVPKACDPGVPAEAQKPLLEAGRVVFMDYLWAIITDKKTYWDCAALRPPTQP